MLTTAYFAFQLKGRGVHERFVGSKISLWRLDASVTFNVHHTACVTFHANHHTVSTPSSTRPLSWNISEGNEIIDLYFNTSHLYCYIIAVNCEDQSSINVHQ